MCMKDLKNVFFSSIGTYASNKGNEKLYPIVVRYFSKTCGVVEAVLDFYNYSKNLRKRLLIAYGRLSKKNNLNLSSVSSYSADNAAINYGKHSLVYQKLKLINSHIVQANCNCQVLNTSVKYAL